MLIQIPIEVVTYLFQVLFLCEALTLLVLYFCYMCLGVLLPN